MSNIIKAACLGLLLLGASGCNTCGIKAKMCEFRCDGKMCEMKCAAEKAACETKAAVDKSIK